MFEDGDGRQGRDGGVPGLGTDALGPAGGGGVGVLDRRQTAEPGDRKQAMVDDPDVHRAVGEVLRGHVSDAARSTQLAGQVAEQAVRCAEPDLLAVMGDLDRLDRDADALKVRMAIEMLDRGLHLEAGMGAIDWLAQQCPWLSRGQVSDLATVAAQGTSVEHRPVLDQVLAGVLPLRRAARVLRALERVRPAVTTAGYAEAVATLLGVAADPQFSDRELKRVTDHLINVALPEREQEAKERAVREMRGIHESSLADGSLVRFMITAEPEGAALIRGIITSPLAAPCPDETGVDSRSATQRRYDALITVLERGLASAKGVPVTAKAKVVVTITLDDLLGKTRGAGMTVTGDDLPASVVRRMACDAHLIPAVLGTEGEVLDVGRTRRLVTAAQWLVLWLRDKHCSFPGCTIPPGWCDTHHIQSWLNGGATDIANEALLCRRHHTLVHERGLTATVTAFGVTWHL